MIHLRSVELKPNLKPPDAFPFNVPIIRTLQPITFTHPVTLLVGENGSGKSTLLETLALAARSVSVSSDPLESDKTLDGLRPLADALKLVWNKPTRRGFFMRAEDFFGYARLMAETQAELRAGYDGAANNLERMPYARELHALKDSYGDGLDAQSHGESFFKLFQSRFAPGGLYLLDEPEAPLSPNRQLTFLAMIGEMVKRDAQFIIATHAPILLAYPGATILSFEDGAIHHRAYDDLEHVSVTRDFLNNPAAFLRHLVDE